MCVMCVCVCVWGGGGGGGGGGHMGRMYQTAGVLHVCSTITKANLFLCLAERQVIHSNPLAEELHRKTSPYIEWYQDRRSTLLPECCTLLEWHPNTAR